MPEIVEPMQWPHYLVNGYILAIIVGFFAISVVIVIRLVRGQSVIPMEPRSDVPWNFILPSLILLLVAFVVLIIVGQQDFGADSVNSLEETSIDQMVSAMCVDSVVKIVIAAGIAALLVAATGASSLDFGFSTKHFAGDIKLGVAAFLFLAPLVYGIQAALSQLSSTVHPIIQILQDHPSVPFFVASLIAAVLVAPLIEEFFFRVILQGWLERFSRREAMLPPVVAELVSNNASEGFRSADALAPSDDLANSIEPVDEVTTASIPFYEPPHTEISFPAPSPSMHSLRPLVTLDARTFVPIVISSIAFALMHFGQGVAPISLFFLALGLGFLYLRTHRIVPCIVVHALLNFTTMMMLWLEVWYPLGVAG